MILATVSLGGALNPFFRSLWRWLRICRTSVSTSALHLAALVPVDQVLDKVAVAHRVQL